MHPYCVYVFDSSTANEAAIAVKEGQYDSIIQYHSSKHQQMANKQHHQQHAPSPHVHSPHLMAGPPSYPVPPPQQPPHHHASPPNPMAGVPPPPPSMAQQAPPTQQQMQQPYDPNLSPQKMKERESKLNRLTQLAALASPNLAPAPPTMHQMTNSTQPQQHQLRPPPPTQPQQQQQPVQQQPPPPPQQQHLDPLSSMAAMDASLDFGHTIHHHPPPNNQLN